MKTKICTKCKLPLPISEFVKDKNSKDGLFGWCKTCKNNNNKTYRKKYPWKVTLYNIKKRCNNPKNERYHQYGGRGIKCLITADELKELWFRDKAYLLKKPSIDREDNDGDYIYENCKYMELGENSIKDQRKTVLQYDLDGNLVNEWISASDASRELKIYQSNISHCCNGEIKTTGGFKWKYK